jgi:hypothetical protein
VKVDTSAIRETVWWMKKVAIYARVSTDSLDAVANDG